LAFIIILLAYQLLLTTDVRSIADVGRATTVQQTVLRPRTSGSLPQHVVRQIPGERIVGEVAPNEPKVPAGHVRVDLRETTNVQIM
jgi:hypothetical protein